MYETGPSADQVSRFLRALRAVRHFRPDAIPDSVVHDLLEVARWTGSATNRQPWEFIVVTERATLQALAEADPSNARHLAGATIALVLVMAGEAYDEETYDEGRLAERIMLAAAGHGLGACIGWFEGGNGDIAKRVLSV